MARVLVIGDTHCPAMHPKYLDHLCMVRDTWQLDTVVHIGDVVDWTAISFHEGHPAFPGAEQEYDLAYVQVQQLQHVFDDVTVLIGNHDCRPARLANTVNIPDFLLRSEQDVWGTPGWTYVERYGFHRIDGVIYQHGERGYGGMRSAIRNAQADFSSMVQGHLHSQCGVNWFCNKNSRIFALQTGCGMDIDCLQDMYARKFNQRPILGCGVVLDGEHAFVEVMRL